MCEEFVPVRKSKLLEILGRLKALENSMARQSHPHLISTSLTFSAWFWSLVVSRLTENGFFITYRGDEAISITCGLSLSSMGLSSKGKSL